MFIIVKENCTAYGTMGGDHCTFSIEKCFFSGLKAEKELTKYEKRGKRENKKLGIEDGSEWGIKYHIETGVMGD